MYEIWLAVFMSHLIIFALVINLLAGTAVFLYVFGAWRRLRRPFLVTLLAYILSFNGLNIVDFCYQYARTNVVKNDPSLVMESPVLASLLLFGVFCAEFAITLSLCRLVERLKGRVLSKAGGRLLGAWVILFAAASVYGLLLLFRDTQWRVFYLVHAAWIFSMILIILGILVSGLFYPVGKGRDLNSVRSFCWIFLVGYSLFAVAHLDFYLFRSDIHNYYDPVMLLLINLCPLLWLRYFYEKGNPEIEITEGYEEKLTEFCGKFGISKREREIIQQVMAGKSNKEIEDILCISFSTVKNHLYNVYQKAGVNSRSELIHRILQFAS